MQQVVTQVVGQLRAQAAKDCQAAVRETEMRVRSELAEGAPACGPEAMLPQAFLPLLQQVLASNMDPEFTEAMTIAFAKVVVSTRQHAAAFEHVFLPVLRRAMQLYCNRQDIMKQCCEAVGCLGMYNDEQVCSCGSDVCSSHSLVVLEGA